MIIDELGHFVCLTLTVRHFRELFDLDYSSRCAPVEASGYTFGIAEDARYESNHYLTQNNGYDTLKNVKGAAKDAGREKRVTAGKYKEDK